MNAFRFTTELPLTWLLRQKAQSHTLEPAYFNLQKFLTHWKATKILKNKDAGLTTQSSDFLLTLSKQK